ncbi:MAG: response regulator [bacterium]
MSKPLIMVVDDEVDVTNAVTKALSRSGKYEIVSANSADEALKLLNKHKVMLGMGGNHIKLVILDIKMPGMTGLEFLEKMRKNFGEDIGVAMLTAFEDEEKWDKATSGFVIDYIRKPFERDDLVKIVDNYFAGKGAQMTLKTFEKHIEKRKDFENKKD